MAVAVRSGPDGAIMNRKINQVLTFQGLERVQVDEAQAGDIVLINGIEEIGIGVDHLRAGTRRKRCRCSPSTNRR